MHDNNVTLRVPFWLQGIFMILDNQEYYGQLVNSEDYELGKAHPDLYSIFDNREVQLGLLDIYQL